MPTPEAFIPQIEPWIDHEESAQLQRAIQSTFISEAQLTQEFEGLTRQLTGAKHAIAAASQLHTAGCNTTRSRMKHVAGLALAVR